MEIGESFSRVYQSVIPEVGFFDTETSYGVVYCYSNVFKLMRNQRSLISELDGLINSTMLAHRAKNLFDQEAALFEQIERVMARLAQQSRAIPFTPKPRRS
jgi:hypothetical protein